MSEDFKGLNAVVTGAGSGIGLAVATMLKAQGAHVFGLDLSEGAMASVATFVKCDVGSDDGVTAAFKEIAQKVQVIDIVINNAGIGAIGTVADSTSEEWLKVLNINVVGISRISSAALPFLRKSKSAAIVNTCSIAATADFVKEGIRVNCVNPGTADTPWVGRLLAQATDPVAQRAALEARQPMGRLVSADEVARAILFLANPLQASTTGTSLAVDGGMQGLRLPK